HVVRGAMPGADELVLFAIQRTSEVEAGVGDGARPTFRPVHMHFAPEERNDDGTFGWNVGQLADFVLHGSNLSPGSAGLPSLCCVMSQGSSVSGVWALDAAAFICMQKHGLSILMQLHEIARVPHERKKNSPDGSARVGLGADGP